MGGGFEQGCVLPLDARRFVVNDVEAEQLSSAWTKLDAKARERCLQLERQVEPGLPQGELDGVGSGFIILTQQCDLVREPKQEPTVEVARISAREAKGTSTLRSLRSWRQLVIAEQHGQALVADSRRRVLLDKRCLHHYPPVQALPDDGRERRRFAWWAGARYFRRPVPTDLYERVEAPLRSALEDDAILAIADRFLMFIVDELDPDRPRLIGLFEEEESREEMEAAMNELFEKVAFVGLSEDDCDAQPIGQASIAFFLGSRSYALDLEGFSSEDSPEPPQLGP
jgi:hypothetical protein